MGDMKLYHKLRREELEAKRKYERDLQDVLPKISSMIREQSRKLNRFMRHSGSFCKMVKKRILENIKEGTESVGFIFETNSKGNGRFVDSTICFPCTNWHVNYHEALEELRSIV